MGLFRLVITSAVAALAAQPLQAARASLPSLTSQVYQADGNQAAITRRANTCAAQLLRSGLQTIPTIMSFDPENGSVVARDTFRIPIGGKGLFATGFDARGQVTIEAKDGRFRMEWSALELLVVDRWDPIEGAQGLVNNATATLNSINNAIADCIKKQGSDNW